MVCFCPEPRMIRNGKVDRAPSNTVIYGASLTPSRVRREPPKPVLFLATPDKKQCFRNHRSMRKPFFSNHNLCYSCCCESVQHEKPCKHERHWLPNLVAIDQILWWKHLQGMGEHDIMPFEQKIAPTGKTRAIVGVYARVLKIWTQTRKSNVRKWIKQERRKRTDLNACFWMRWGYQSSSSSHMSLKGTLSKEYHSGSISSDSRGVPMQPL